MDPLEPQVLTKQEEEEEEEEKEEIDPRSLKIKLHLIPTTSAVQRTGSVDPMFGLPESPKTRTPKNMRQNLRPVDDGRQIHAIIQYTMRAHKTHTVLIRLQVQQSDRSRSFLYRVRDLLWERCLEEASLHSSQAHPVHLV